MALIFSLHGLYDTRCADGGILCICMKLSWKYPAYAVRCFLGRLIGSGGLFVGVQYEHVCVISLVCVHFIQWVWAIIPHAHL